jgi:hypothetical protein
MLNSVVGSRVDSPAKRTFRQLLLGQDSHEPAIGPSSLKRINFLTDDACDQLAKRQWFAARADVGRTRQLPRRQQGSPTADCPSFDRQHAVIL